MIPSSNPSKVNLNLLSFLHHILADVPPAEMHHTFKRHNISAVKFEVYQHFIHHLVDTVYDTYLGNDCIYREADVAAHFRWCYTKTCSDLKDKGFRFEENQELYEYFLEYFRIGLYLCETSRETDLAYFRSFFTLQPDKPLKYSDLDSLTDLYGVFDKSLLRGRNLVSSR